MILIYFMTNYGHIHSSYPISILASTWLVAEALIVIQSQLYPLTYRGLQNEGVW
jgi:hypothetical protein